MSNTVLIGLQWGDEGKGKIIDVLTEKAEIVVRFQGGDNAGHTVEVGSDTFVLHLIPSGILHQGTLCVIGNGVVLNPHSLIKEMNGLKAKGIDCTGRLQISSRAHLLFQYHCLLDGLSESKLGEGKIGTTKRGIGPAYMDKVGRSGVRAVELCHPETLEKYFRLNSAKCNEILKAHGQPEMDVDAEWLKLREAAAELAPYVADTALGINRAIRENKRILFEGAQGTWLDVDFGTYPFVTSSNTTSGGACIGSGVAPSRIQKVVGVAKAYSTRVGSGPFPTELECAIGERLRKIGREFGATTGRPRRCGWFDAVATRYAVMLNGADALAITKMDVLDDFDTLNICTAYEIDGRRVTDMPSDPAEFARAKPVYEEMPGWKADTSRTSSWADLPPKAQAYLARLAELIESKIEIISVGPNRSQTFFVD